MALEQLNITTQEMKDYLRVDHNMDDELIQLLVESAKEHAEAFLNNDFTTKDEDGNIVYLTIPSVVKLGCMRMVASWYDHRDDSTQTSHLGNRIQSQGEIPWEVQTMLWPHKKLVGT